MNSLSIDQTILEAGLVLIEESKVMINLSNYAYYPSKSDDIIVLNRLLLEYAFGLPIYAFDQEFLYMNLYDDLLFNDILHSLLDKNKEEVMVEQLSTIVTLISNALYTDNITSAEMNRYIIKWVNPLDYICVVASFSEDDELY